VQKVGAGRKLAQLEQCLEHGLAFEFYKEEEQDEHDENKLASVKYACQKCIQLSSQPSAYLKISLENLLDTKQLRVELLKERHQSILKFDRVIG